MRGFIVYSLCFAVLGFASNVIAAEGQPAFIKKNEPIEIEADALLILQEKNQAIFKGNVEAVQGKNILRSRKMTVHYKESGSGDGISSEGIDYVEAEGDVVLISEKGEHSTSDYGLYDPDKATVTLKGNVFLKKKGSTLGGDSMIYNLATGDSVIKSDPKKRIKSTIAPTGK